jgi:hypothetical protein
MLAAVFAEFTFTAVNRLFIVAAETFVINTKL